MTEAKLAEKRERGRKRAAKWRERHPETHKQRLGTYHTKNRNTILAGFRGRYAANPELFKESNLKSIKKHRSCISCSDWPDWREGLKHYDGHCYRCFSHKFPGHAKVHTKQRVEYEVRAFINAHFQDFVHNKPMHTAHCCPHRRQVDHRREVGNTLLCVETDEHHHRGYDKDDEEARYHDSGPGRGPQPAVWRGAAVLCRRWPPSPCRGAAPCGRPPSSTSASTSGISRPVLPRRLWRVVVGWVSCRT